jgi:hypothetical protein
MMAEAAAVIGLVSAIVQLVQFGSKIVNRLDEFQSNVGQVPQTFRDIKNQLPLLLNALRRTKKDVQQIVKRLQAYVSTLTYHQAAGSPKALSVRTKPLFTVPFERDPNFVGRSDILEQADQKLKAHGRAALAGIGGVGQVTS